MSLRHGGRGIDRVSRDVSHPLFASPFLRVVGACLLVLAGCGPAASPNEDRPSSAPESGDPGASASGDVAADPDRRASASPAPSEAGLFTEDPNLAFVHFNGMAGRYYLAEITCGGAGLFDADGDGDLDAYLSQGRLLGEGLSLDDALRPPGEGQGSPPTDRFFLNDGPDPESRTGARLWTDATTSWGLDGTVEYGCGVAVGDVNNDGRLDLYVTNLGANRLLLNRGDRFEDRTRGSGAEDAGNGVTAAFLDYDRDGDLDLFVGNNVTFVYENPPFCRDLAGAQDWCGPGAFDFEPDRLLRNRGDGTFDDVSREAGLRSLAPRPTLGVVAADFDEDGWIDLYVANDGQPNTLWINRGDGTFEDQALLAGAAVNGGGEAEASMGVDAADFDRDGDLDLFLAHLIRETNTLYRNEGAATFADVTATVGLGAPSLGKTAFGTGFLDVDNDGWLDLIVVNGAVTKIPNLARQGDPFPLHQTNQLFLGNPGGRFEDASSRGGEAFARSEVSRALALGDVDDDGDLDALISNNAGPARLLINQVGQDGGWLGLRLAIPLGNARTPAAPGSALEDVLRDALGASVRIRLANGLVLVGRVRSEGSYNSAHDSRLLFGLGNATGPATAEVRWPDGAREVFDSLETGRYTTLIQGRGRAPATVTPAP